MRNLPVAKENIRRSKRTKMVKDEVIDLVKAKERKWSLFPREGISQFGSNIGKSCHPFVLY